MASTQSALRRFNGATRIAIVELRDYEIGLLVISRLKTSAQLPNPQTSNLLFHSSNQLGDGITSPDYGQGSQSMAPILWRTWRCNVVSSKLFSTIADIGVVVKGFAKLKFKPDSDADRRGFARINLLRIRANPRLSASYIA